LGISVREATSVLRLARQYTPEEFAEYCQLRRPDGTMLKWDCLRLLLRFSRGEKDIRRKVQERLAAEGWSPEKLHAHLRDNYAWHGMRHGRKVRIPPPAEFESYFQEMSAEARTLVRRREAMLTAILNLPKRERAIHLSKLASQVLDLVEQLREVVVGS
jgi:hypothetical protein